MDTNEIIVTEPVETPDVETNFVKAVFPLVLGNRYEAIIIERFKNKEDAEASSSPGDVMTVDEFNTKNESWSKVAIIPVNE